MSEMSKLTEIWRIITAIAKEDITVDEYLMVQFVIWV